jgi:hypothetical protein
MASATNKRNNTDNKTRRKEMQHRERGEQMTCVRLLGAFNDVVAIQLEDKKKRKKIIIPKDPPL